MVLFKKMIRDMWSSRMQFITIIVMAALGVFAYSAITTVGLRLEKSVEKFYSEVNMNDLWIQAENISDADILKVQKLPGIEAVQGRMQTTVYSENRKLELFALDENTVSKPYLIKGELFDPEKGGIWLDNEFAKANQLNPGEAIYVTINEREVGLTICGLILSAEKACETGSSNGNTQHNSNGYGFVSHKTASSSLGGYTRNELILKVEKGADQAAIIEGAEGIFGNRFIVGINWLENGSTSTVQSQIAQFKIIAYLFPILFFILALLTMTTTMTRMISKQRVQIGTLMSLGFSNRQVKWHYLSYGLWMGLAGGITGLILGYAVASSFMWTLTEAIILPKWSDSYALQALFSIAVIVAFCLLAVLMSCGSSLKEMPAKVLRGIVKVKNRKSFFEHFPVLWERFSFESKWAFRNLSSSRVRSIMGIIGSFGCTFLVLFGLASNNTAYHTLSSIYDVQMSFEYKALVNNPDKELEKLINNKKEKVQWIQEGNMELRNNHIRRNLSFTVLDKGNLLNFTGKKESYDFSDTGITISEKTADVLKVKEGDMISWRFGNGDWNQVRIAALIPIANANQVIVPKAAWEKMDQAFEATALLIGSNSGIDIPVLQENNSVEQLLLKSEIKAEAYRLNSGNLLTLGIFTFVALLLGSTILYSLGLLSLTEMSREYATLKVLGFYHKEIKTLLFRENIMLCFVGILFALPCGIIMLKYYILLSQSERMVLTYHVKTSSIMISAAVTLLCCIVINLLMSRKIKSVDMVTSLKGNE